MSRWYGSYPTMFAIFIIRPTMFETHPNGKIFLRERVDIDAHKRNLQLSSNFTCKVSQHHFALGELLRNYLQCEPDTPSISSTGLKIVLKSLNPLRLNPFPFPHECIQHPRVMFLFMLSTTHPEDDVFSHLCQRSDDAPKIRMCLLEK